MTTMRVLLGDCRTLMAEMDEASVDSICTDPPYELGFMGRAWDSTGIAYDVEMWKAALRVLKPGGHLVAFSHSRTYHRMACAIEDAGFEIRDQIMWLYGSGFPKARNLKPAHEPIVLARKPFAGSREACVAEFGTGGLDIEGCRVPTDDVLAAGSGGIPCRHDPAVPRGRAGEASADRRYAERGSTDFAPTPGPRGGSSLGRYPANVVHDGSGAIVDAFPTAPGQRSKVTGDEPTGNGFSGAVMYGGFNGGRDCAEPRNDTGSAARFYYCAKASKADRDEGLADFALQQHVQFQTANGTSGKASSISAGRGTQYRNTHPTVKPTALMRWLCRLVTPAGGTVLDPFTGSGSTGKAAALEGFGFIGCEMTAEYVPIAEARIAAAAVERLRLTAEPSLFGEVA